MVEDVPSIVIDPNSVVRKGMTASLDVRMLRGDGTSRLVIEG
jgi:hypothetical protein